MQKVEATKLFDPTILCFNVLLHSLENNEVSQLETGFQFDFEVHESISEKLI